MPAPLKIAELNDISLSVKDFLYIENEIDKDFLFIAVSDSKITSKIDAYITNLTFPWEKESTAPMAIGALIIYSIEKKSKDNSGWKFDKKWAKTYNSETNILCWDKITKLLCLGMVD